MAQNALKWVRGLSQTRSLLMIEALRNDCYHPAGIRADVSDLASVRRHHKVIVRGSDGLGPAAVSVHGIGARTRRWLDDGAINVHRRRKLKATLPIISGDPNYCDRSATNRASAV